MPEGGWANLAFAVMLLVASLVLLIRGTRWSGDPPQDDQEARHINRQARRRWIVNVLLGVLGFAMLGGIWVVGTIASMIYWSAMLILVLAVFVLVIMDLVAVRSYFKVLLARQQAERKKLEAEVDRLRSRREDEDLSS